MNNTEKTPAMPRRLPSEPETLTNDEVARVLRAIDRSVDGVRDYTIVRLALHTGLRLSELCALDLRDVVNGHGVKSRILLRPEITKMGVGGEINLSPRMQRRLKAYVQWRAGQKHDQSQNAPLFVTRGGPNSKRGDRVSVRAVQAMWDRRQVEAGLDRHYRFHALRHTAITAAGRAAASQANVNPAVAAKKFGRHRSFSSTWIYMHPSADEMAKTANAMPW